MSADDDLFALAGLSGATPSHWTPIVRTQDFEAQQKATRARLAETYEPGQSERSMVPGGPFIHLVQLNIDASVFAAAYKDLLAAAVRAQEAMNKPLFEPYHMTWWDEPKWAGVKTAAPKPRKPNFDEMTPRDRALAMKNERARAKGIEGTKRALKPRRSALDSPDPGGPNP